MAEQLQALLDRIHEEGVKKTAQESEKLLAETREKVSQLRAEAKAEAGKIIEDARKEAEKLAEKGRETMRQAARDTLLSLRGELQERLHKVVRACVDDAVAGESLVPLLAEVVKSFASNIEGETKLELLVAEAELEKLQKGLLAKLGSELKQNPELAPDKSVHAGFKLKISGEEVVYDFTDEALAEVLCLYLNPKLAELVKSA